MELRSDVGIIDTLKSFKGRSYYKACQVEGEKEEELNLLVKMKEKIIEHREEVSLIGRKNE